jgi:hypothetical protein
MVHVGVVVGCSHLLPAAVSGRERRRDLQAPTHEGRCPVQSRLLVVVSAVAILLAFVVGSGPVWPGPG